MGEGTGGSEAHAQRFGEDEFGTYKIDERAWTMNEIRDHPLFMEDVPSDISDNPHLLALQSIMYDGQTPEELAEHFRKLGNDAFKVSPNKVASQNALLAYTRGLEMECKDKVVNSQLHSNRAAVSLRLNEYSKAVDDCRKAIEMDPGNVKAHFRAAKASEALGLTAQALEFCTGALEVCPEEKEVQQFRARLSQQLKQDEEHRCTDRRALEGAARDRKLGESAVRAVLGSRGVELGPFLFDMAMYAQGGAPMPRLSDDGDAVQWPLMFLYDEVSQSDFVESFDERCLLDEQLELMFPAERRVDWDEEGKYVWDRLAVYMECYPQDGSDTQMCPLATNTPLQETLCERHVPPCLVLHVLARGSPAHKHFCSEQSLPSV